MTHETIEAEKFLTACAGDLLVALDKLERARDILRLQGRKKGVAQVEKMLVYLIKEYKNND